MGFRQVESLEDYVRRFLAFLLLLYVFLLLMGLGR